MEDVKRRERRKKSQKGRALTRFLPRISWPDGAFDYNASRFGMGLLGEGERVTHDWQVGPEVTHVYDVTNQGPSDLPQAQIFLLWPTRTLGGDPLLYLLEEPDVSSEAVCHSVPDVNYLGLTVRAVGLVGAGFLAF